MQFSQLTAEIKLLKTANHDVDPKFFDICLEKITPDFLAKGGKTITEVQDCLKSSTDYQIDQQLRIAKLSLDRTKSLAKNVIVEARRCLLSTPGHVHDLFEQGIKNCLQKVSINLKYF